MGLYTYTGEKNQMHTLLLLLRRPNHVGTDRWNGNRDKDSKTQQSPAHLLRAGRSGKGENIVTALLKHVTTAGGTNKGKSKGMPFLEEVLSPTALPDTQSGVQGHHGEVEGVWFSYQEERKKTGHLYCSIVPRPHHSTPRFDLLLKY